MAVGVLLAVLLPVLGAGVELLVAAAGVVELLAVVLLVAGVVLLLVVVVVLVVVLVEPVLVLLEVLLAVAGCAGASTDTVSSHERIAHKPSCLTTPSNLGI